MASALEQALPDIPDKSALAGKSLTMAGFSAFTAEQWANLNCFERFAGLQNRLTEFIAYLRVGGCEIG